MRRATIAQLVHGVRVAADVLGVQRGVYCVGGAIALPLGDGWALAISADYAERLRLQVCLHGLVVASMWSFPGDDGRLADLALSARGEAAALTA